MSELGQNLTSSWVRAAGRFGHTPEKPLVMFYVEGDEDVPFGKKSSSLIWLNMIFKSVQIRL